jgi:hypothetical protein
MPSDTLAEKGPSRLIYPRALWFRIAETHTDPAELINSAVDALVRRSLTAS